MAIKPYRPKVKKVSGRELKLLDAVYSYLPRAGIEEGLLEGLAEVVAEDLGEEPRLSLEAVIEEGFASFVQKLPSNPFIAVIGFPPQEAKVLCEIDSTLAMMAVERMLGGHAQAMPEPRELSDTEQGVIQYLILRILAHVHARCGGDAAGHMRLERIAASLDAVSDLVQPGSMAAVLAFRVVVGRHAGFVRLCFPEPFAAQSTRAGIGAEQIGPAERGRLTSGMARMGYVRLPIWAEAGRSTVMAEDVSRLEEGDVILLEGGDLSLSGGTMGNAVLRIGSGQVGGLDVVVELGKRRARCSVRGTHKGD